MTQVGSRLITSDSRLNGSRLNSLYGAIVLYISTHLFPIYCDSFTWLLYTLPSLFPLFANGCDTPTLGGQLQPSFLTFTSSLAIPPVALVQ